LRLFSFGGYGLALAAFALVVFGAIECPPLKSFIADEILLATVIIHIINQSDVSPKIKTHS